MDISHLYKIPALKKEVEKNIHIMQQAPDSYKLSGGGDGYEYMIDIIADENSGKYMPDNIAVFFGTENLGYELGDDDLWRPKGEEDAEGFEEISEDEFVWDGIDRYADLVAKEIGEKVAVDGVAFYFGFSEGGGDYGLFMVADDAVIEGEKE